MKKFLTSEELSTKDEFSFRLIAFLSFFSRRDFIVIFVYAYRFTVVISVRIIGVVIAFFLGLPPVPRFLLRIRLLGAFLPCLWLI